MAALPAAGRPVPVSTYRVQLRPPAEDHPGCTFDDAASMAPYLADLGITHLYCSPYLQAAPGSAHGYDVVDPTRLNAELGGVEGHARLVRACRDAGLGLVLDVVPNHVAVSEPESQNPAWWSLLAQGQSSPYARWFDVDWAAPACPGKVLVPVLGGPLEEVLPELTVDGDRIRYYDHEFPIAEGTLVPGDVAATLERQHYRLADWRLGGTALNYRRFFDVTTLAGVRVEDPLVLDQTHAVVLAQVETGLLDGLRIDHPDGLADPGGYLDRLAERTGGAWVVVEKILEPGEQLPASWACAGTTGYDVLNDVLRVFVDPAGEAPLTAHWQAASGSTADFAEVTAQTKHLVLDRVLAAEVDRLAAVARAALPDPPARLREALVEVLAGFAVYRAYVRPGEPPGDTARAQVQEAVRHATAGRPELAGETGVVGLLALGEAGSGPAGAEFVTRFQQTCGPVMAKAVEDTAFYRYARLLALNEVGGSPARFGLPAADFHAANAARLRDWPVGMTTLSTHDTKRSEDVRARLALLSQAPERWVEAVTGWSAQAGPLRAGLDGGTEQLVWQTLFGAHPLPADRAWAYLRKAVREAKERTSWLAPDEAYEQVVERFVRGVLADPALAGSIGDLAAELDWPWRATLLAQKLVQLTVPGVADTYQGSELVDLSLVDPDNRRPVDVDLRRRLLADPEPGDGADAQKLRVTATALRLRREHPDWFLTGSTYQALDAGERALAYARSSRLVVVVPTRAVAVARDGWGADAVELPSGGWLDLLGGGTWSGRTRLGDLLGRFPVALLWRERS